MRRALSTLVILAGLAALPEPLAACLNDSETVTAENEFNSAYRTPTRMLGRIFQPASLLMAVPPLLLLGLGCYWTVTERRARAKREAAWRARQQRRAARRSA